MELKLRFIGNSEVFVLQSQSDVGSNWVERCVIEQDKDGYQIRTETGDICVLKQYEQISDKERLMAQSSHRDIIFYERQQLNHFWEFPYWQGILRQQQNEYMLVRIGSGTKGDILPVTKNGKPVAVFAVSNLSVAGKRGFSLYTEESDEIGNVLLLYVINYIKGLDIVDIDSLMINYRVFYQLDGRSALTSEHIAMLPLSNRPSKIEAIFWRLSWLVVIGLSGLLSLKYLLSFFAILVVYHSCAIIRNFVARLCEQ